MKTKVQAHSTTQKFVKELISVPIAPLPIVLVNWLENPRQFRDSLSGVFVSMYEEAMQKRGEYS